MSSGKSCLPSPAPHPAPTVKEPKSRPASGTVSPQLPFYNQHRGGSCPQASLVQSFRGYLSLNPATGFHEDISNLPKTYHSTRLAR